MPAVLDFPKPHQKRRLCRKVVGKLLDLDEEDDRLVAPCTRTFSGRFETPAPPPDILDKLWVAERASADYI